jgi:hypothetical protein
MAAILTALILGLLNRGLLLGSLSLNLLLLLNPPLHLQLLHLLILQVSDLNR